MTDDENKPVCRATLRLTKGEYDCVLLENHVGRHRDEDGDTWGITYRDAQTAPLTEDKVNAALLLLERRVRAEVSRVAARLDRLETAWAPGGETLSERLDRVVLGMTEQLRTTTALAQAVCIDPSDLSGLLRDREELHALRNAAQADVTADTVDSPRLMEITRDRLHELQTDARRLAALEQAGVDNWSGYDHAMEILRDLEAEHEIHVCTVNC